MQTVNDIKMKSELIIILALLDVKLCLRSYLINLINLINNIQKKFIYTYMSRIMLSPNAYLLYTLDNYLFARVCVYALFHRVVNSVIFNNYRLKFPP